nr:hypothetical protein Itr_chr12CG28520 [Ipomoea trifida]
MGSFRSPIINEPLQHTIVHIILHCTVNSDGCDDIVDIGDGLRGSGNFLLRPCVNNQSGQLPGVNQSQDSSSQFISLSQFLPAAMGTQEESRQRPPPATASGSIDGVATSVVAVGDVGNRMERLWWWSERAGEEKS